MNLEQIRERSMDDILFMLVRKAENKSLPVEFSRTDDLFFRGVYELYNLIEDNRIIYTIHEPKIGFTTAMYFVMAYYSLHQQELYLVTNSSVELIKKTFDLFYSFLDLQVDVNKKSNQLIIKHSGNIISTVNMKSSVWDYTELKAFVFFDNLKFGNISKYDDLLKMAKKNNGLYDRILLNFPDSKEINNLVDTHGIKKETVKIL